MLTYTADDVAEAARDLALLLDAHAEETDAKWADVLADHIASDARWLAEMIEVVSPPLQFTLPMGLPAPGPVRGVGR
jgi:cytosine/adenosine deaminase-related metal-dependent hydrolase